MGVVTIVKALFTRLLFATHSFITIWRVVGLLGNPYYWGLTGGLLLLIIETLYTLIKRKGHEYKWICPAFFFYLCSAVPGIWFLELDRLTRYQNAVKNLTASTSAPSKEGQNSSESGGGDVGLSAINGATIPIAFTPDMWVLVIEQSLMFLLVIGRWLLPKGEITRDQLSQLLFVYIGLASDIMELFVLFDEKQVLLHPFLSYIILAIWNMSLMQFVLVLTATKARRKEVALIRPSTHEPGDKEPECSGCCGGKCCENEVWSIMITVILQDAPFLCLRLYVMVTFNLFNYTILFFTVKNALVIVLQFYRLIVVTCLSKEDGGDDDDDEETGKRGFDNQALIDDDSGEVISETAWSRAPPSGMKRRSPVGAAAGVTAGHPDSTAWGERFRNVDSPTVSNISKGSNSLVSICSMPAPKGVTDAGTAMIIAANVKPGTPVQANTPGQVRLVRVASASSNIVTPHDEMSDKRSTQSKPNELPPIQTQPTPNLGWVKPSPKPPARTKPKSPKVPTKISPSSTKVSLSEVRGAGSPDIITAGISNTPPPGDVSKALAKEDAMRSTEDDVKLLDYEETTEGIDEIVNNMGLGDDIVEQGEMKPTSGSATQQVVGIKTDNKGSLRSIKSEEYGKRENVVAEVNDTDDIGIVEEIGDQELEELFATTEDEGDVQSERDESTVEVLEAVGTFDNNRKVQTVIDVEPSTGVATNESET